MSISLLTILLLSVAIAKANNDPSIPYPADCEQFSSNDSVHLFTSPLFPNDYPNDIQCTKIIEAPLHHVIRLQFIETFGIEYSPSCSHDYLEIRDGQFGYSHLLRGERICGTNPPTHIESKGRFLWLQFKTDMDLTMQGFKVQIEFIETEAITDPLESCGQTFVNQTNGIIDTTELLSPEIINSRVDERHIDCTWIIEAEPNWRIRIQFNDYSLDRPNDCEFNFVEFYGEKTELNTEGGFLTKFCGSDKDSVSSAKNKFHLRFYSGFNRKDEKFTLKSSFKAYFNVFRDTSQTEPKECNKNTEFDCTDNTCVSFDLKCNGQVDCKLKTDEEPTLCFPPITFQLRTNILIIAFLGVLLMSGMCSGLLLNVYRKLKEDAKWNEHGDEEEQEQEKKPTKTPSKSTSSSSSNKSTIIYNTNGSGKPEKSMATHPRLMEMRDSACQTINIQPSSPKEAPPQPQTKPADLVVWMK